MKVLSNLDLVGNELQNAVVQNLAAPPSNPRTGQEYTDTSVTPPVVKYWNGTAWVPMTGKIPLDQVLKPENDVDMNGKKLINLATPTSDTDAATKQYVDENLPSGGVGKYAEDIGNGALTNITVTHNLNTQDVTVTVIEKATNSVVYCDVQVPTVNTILLVFSTAPAIGQYRCVVIG